MASLFFLSNYGLNDLNDLKDLKLPKDLKDPKNLKDPIKKIVENPVENVENP